MTLEASVSNVHVHPKPRQVACPVGSHVGSRPWSSDPLCHQGVGPGPVSPRRGFEPGQRV